MDRGIEDCSTIRAKYEKSLISECHKVLVFQQSQVEHFGANNQLVELAESSLLIIHHSNATD